MSTRSEPPAARLRRMGVTASVRTTLALLGCGLLSGCAGVPSGGGDCVSHYEPVGEASTWGGLKNLVMGYTERGRVASLRTQARGDDVGVGNEDAVRVVDLLDRNGKRLAQIEVWRTEAGTWSAGIWSQCID